MTAKPVQWVLDELGAVVDAQPADHPLKRVDRDNSLLYDGGGAFDMSASITERTPSFKKANYVGAGFVGRSGSYVGTEADRDLQETIGVRIEGATESYCHIDPRGEDGVVFHGTDSALVEQIRSTLFDALEYPDAGRTNVGFTHLDIVNQTPALTDWESHYRYDFDVVFDGFETL